MRFQTLYEGRWIFAVLLILGAVGLGLHWPWLVVLTVLLVLFCLNFFRDPDREIPPGDDVIVAAADGVVADIVEIEEPEVLKTKCQRVGIFLNVFDVHVNKAPVGGTIIYRHHHPGAFLDARDPECSVKNEALTWAIRGDRATLVVRQITGAIARRIVPWSKVGDVIPKGFRFGMIRFGSRTEIYLPLTSTIEVKIGDRGARCGNRDRETRIENTPMSDDGSPKIYLLPNLATAGNLFCGFAATLKILEGAMLLAADPTAQDAAADNFHNAIWLILASCFFDLLDGRLARLGGNESAFGREFDSLADIVSFGVAPALMVYRIVLHEFPKIGWVIASLYLVCGALRLARFNCLAAENSAAANKEFKGFPIPAAAGVIASITLFMLWLDEKNRDIGNGKWVLPPLMVFLSWMMFSRFRYPSFKAINWRTKRSLPRFILIVAVLAMTAMYYEWMPAVIFVSYLLYGFLRPFLSRKMKEEIEEEIEDDDDEVGAAPDLEIPKKAE